MRDFIFKYQWVLILFVAAIGGFLCMDLGHEWGDDFALYLHQARCWVDGGMDVLAAENKDCMDTSDGLLGPYLYPQGFPLFLSFFIRLFGLLGLKGLPLLLALKMANFIVFLLLLTVFLRLLNIKFEGNRNKILLAFVLIAWHPKIWEAADRLSSDLWFTGLVILFFYALNVEFKAGWTKILTLCLLVLVATATRSNGVFLVAAWLIQEFLVWQQSGKSEGLVPAFLLGGLSGFLALSADAGNGSNHWVLLREIRIETIVDHIGVYFQMAGTYPFWHLATAMKLFPWAVGFVWLGALIFWILVILGAIRSGSKWIGAVVFLLLNLALYVVWPSVQGMRFLFPLLPLLIIFFVQGLDGLWRKLLPMITAVWTKMPARIAMVKNWVWGIALVILLQGMMTSVFYVKLDTNQAYSKSAIELYDFVLKSVNPEEKVSFFKPRLMHYVTGAKVYRIAEDGKGDVVERLKEKGIEYWVVRKRDAVRFVPENLLEVFENEQFVVYRIARN